jgi:hypothetical protein
LSNGFVQFLERAAVDCCFWWEKFTQQEVITIPQHSHHFFWQMAEILIVFMVGE